MKVTVITGSPHKKGTSALPASQAVALVTPLYYFGFSAQIKTVIDRFYANSYKLTGGKKDKLSRVIRTAITIGFSKGFCRILVTA